MAATEFGFTVMVDVVLFGEPATNVTVAVSLTDPMVAVIVSTCALELASVAVMTPELLVFPDAGLNVLLVPDPASVTAWPLMGLPCASFTVTVSCVVVLLSATRLVRLATKLDVVFETAPGTKLTLLLTLKLPIVAVSDLFSATVDERVVLH